MITLLTTSVAMSALALIYMAATPLLSRRYSEKGRYYVWLIIVIGLIIPFRPQFAPFSQWGVPVEAALTINMESAAVADVHFLYEDTALVAALPSFKDTVSASSLPSVEWWQIGFAAWLVGMIVFLTYHTVKHYRFLKMMKRWSESVDDKHILEALQSLKSQMRISARVGLYRCSSIDSPMMIGFTRPRILLPGNSFTQDEIHFILGHELVHYKRKDLYYKGLVLLAVAIHWFNPVVYLMARVISSQCESSCDAQVVWGTDTGTRQSYSETIIGVVKYQSKLKTALSTNFYGGKKGMKNRILSIMDTSRKKTGIAILCAALIVTLGTGTMFATTSDTSVGESLHFANPYIGVTLITDNAVFVPYSAPLTPEELAERRTAAFEIYRDFGLLYDPVSDRLYFGGELVRYFEDMIPFPGYQDASFGMKHFTENGTVDVRAVRDFSQLTSNEATALIDGLLGLEPFTQAEFDARDIDALASQPTLRFYGSQESSPPVPATVYAHSNQPATPGRLLANTFLEYEEWGIAFDSITINSDGTVSFRTPTNVFYRGQLVRTFADVGNGFWHSSVGNTGGLSIAIIRDDTGSITGIEEIRSGSLPNAIRDRSGNIIGER